MVSNPAPSTSLQDIRCEGLECILQEDPQSICVLDCRTDGPSIKFANRVRLPNVLFRRLQQCSLALSNVCSRLSDTSTKVVIIPGTGNDAAMSDALSNALQKEGYTFVVVNEPIDVLTRVYPDLFAEDNRSPNERFASDVGCLNLNRYSTLRIVPETKNDKRLVFPVQILPHLYLGNAETAKNSELLESHGIHHIINVTSNLPNEMENDNNFKYFRISVDDNSSHDLTKFFPEAINFINEAESAGDACLVHCLAGISRSVTVCLAYLMATRRCSLDQAYDVVLKCNARIAPNFHFMGQLHEYQKRLGIKGNNTPGLYSTGGPRSPCSLEAAATSGLLTPPPTSCSASPQSSSHSAKSFD